MVITCTIRSIQDQLSQQGIAVSYGKKISKRTEWVEHTMTYSEIYKTLISLKKVYTTHKYQVFNDQFHWPKILATANDIGEIYHMDYSET